MCINKKGFAVAVCSKKIGTPEITREDVQGSPENNFEDPVGLIKNYKIFHVSN